MEHWRDAWLPPLLAALMSQDARLRTNTAHYLLPLPLAMDSGSLPVLLSRLDAAAADDAANGDCTSVSTGRVSCGIMALLKLHTQSNTHTEGSCARAAALKTVLAKSSAEAVCSAHAAVT